MISVLLRMSCAVIDPCASPEKKQGERMYIAQATKRINIIAVFKTQPGASGTLP